MTEEQMLLLQDFKRLRQILLDVFDAIDIYYSMAYSRIEIHMRKNSFLDKFNDYNLEKKDHAEFYPYYTLSTNIDGFYFFALKTLPQKEKPLVGAEVI
jgi:hypothetical protein